MPGSIAPPAPRAEAALPAFFRRLRWALGWITDHDLAGRSDLELLDLGEVLLRRGRMAQVGKVLAAFSARATSDPRVLVRYGDLARALGGHESTIISHLRAAELYAHSGAVQKAVAVLGQLVRSYPDQLEPRLAAARAYEALGRRKEAALQYRAAACICEALGDRRGSAELGVKIAELLPITGTPSAPPPPIASGFAPQLLPQQPEAAPSIDSDDQPIVLDDPSLYRPAVDRIALAPPPDFPSDISDLGEPAPTVAMPPPRFDEPALTLALNAIPSDASEPALTLALSAIDRELADPGDTINMAALDLDGDLEAGRTLAMSLIGDDTAGHVISPITEEDLQVRPEIAALRWRDQEDPPTRSYGDADEPATLLDLKASDVGDALAALRVEVAPQETPPRPLPPSRHR